MNSINLKKLRSLVGLTQDEVAARLNVTKQTIWKWEAGKAPVCAKHMVELQELFNVTEDELEDALVQTLVDAAYAEGSDRILKNAVAARRYNMSKLNGALVMFQAQREPARHISPAQRGFNELELREEILKLKEENFELRKRIFELEQLLNIPSGDVSITSKSSSHNELETVK